MKTETRQAESKARPRVATNVVAAVCAAAAADSTRQTRREPKAGEKGDNSRINKPVEESAHVQIADRLLEYLKQSTDPKKAISVIRSEKSGVATQEAEAAIARFAVELEGSALRSGVFQ